MDDLMVGRIAGLVLFIILIIFAVFYFNMASNQGVESGILGNEADEIKQDIIEDLNVISKNLEEIENYDNE